MKVRFTNTETGEILQCENKNLEPVKALRNILRRKIVAELYLSVRKLSSIVLEIVEWQRICYYIDESMKDENGQFCPVIVKEGVSGYFKTDYRWGKDFQIAKQATLRANHDLNLTRRDVDTIVASSMKAQLHD